MVSDFRPAFLQQFHQNVTGRFAIIIDVRLVGEAQDENLRAIQRLAQGIKRFDHAVITYWGMAVLISPASSMNRVL